MIDVYSKGKYPANELSNFAKHPFEFRGFVINSMEGLIQGLTYKDPIAQMKVFLLDGYSAKSAGLPWEFSQTLYWQGSPILRYSKDYQDLLDDAYDALYTNTNFKKALHSTGHQVIRHTIGCRVQSKTLLTEQEFVTRLTSLRDNGTCKKESVETISLF